MMTETAVEIPGYVAGTWTIDPVHSEVSFVVKHMMVRKVRSRFDKIKGTIVTAPDPLQVEGYGSGRDAIGGTRAGFSASGEINRHDFGVSYDGPVPGGVVIVSEKVSSTLEIEGLRTKPD